jgi:hypothetical protein
VFDLILLYAHSEFSTGDTDQQGGGLLFIIIGALIVGAIVFFLFREKLGM